jgi:hypothetical protein
MAAISQSGAPLVLEATDPIVAGSAADSIVGAELGHGVWSVQMIGDEAFALLHG